MGNPVRVCEAIPQDRRSGRCVFHLHEDKPISFNCSTRRLHFDVEKKDSIKTRVVDALEVGGRLADKDGERRAGQCRECLLSASNPTSIVPSFNTFTSICDDYRKEPAQRDIKVEKSDQHRQYARHNYAALSGRALRDFCSTHGEHRPARQAVHRLEIDRLKKTANCSR